MSDYDSDDSSNPPPPIRSKVVTINDPSGEDASYIFTMQLVKDFEYDGHKHVNVELKYSKNSDEQPSPKKKRKFQNTKTTNIDKSDDDNDNVIGYLRGNLLRRPSKIFFEMADADSGELQKLACLFCESDGTASRIEHPTLVDKSPKAVYSGGFFHIEAVEVRKQHKGKDLGLRLIHESLAFLDDLWTLAVMEAVGLHPRNLKWSDNVRYDIADCKVGGPHDLDPPISAEEAATTQERIIKVQRQFGRMGFLQAGRSTGRRDAFFLTKESYFGNSDTTNLSAAIDKWIPKCRAETELELFIPPPKHELSDLDRDLKSLVLNLLGVNQFGINRTTDVSIDNIEGIVRRGASINNSCVMHVATANTDGADLSVLDRLVRLGGDVNATDDDGNTPLHVAAALMKVTVVRYLLGCGADIVSATNLDGETPLDTFVSSVQNSNDFAITMGLDRKMVREVDIVPKLETAKALMSLEQRNSLIEGWMTPRMHKCLCITAELQAEEDDHCDLFTPYQPTPLKDVCQSWDFTHVEYIPMKVLKFDPNGIYKSFYDAWKMIMLAISEVLNRRVAPTVNSIRDELHNNNNDLSNQYDLRKLEHYEARGGKIEFALDAIIKSTENVVIKGDDGWEYETFRHDIEDLPENPLDKMYDVAKFMCFTRGGGTLEEHGPHNDVYRLTFE